MVFLFFGFTSDGFFFHRDETPKLISFNIFDRYVLDSLFKKLLALLASGYDKLQEGVQSNASESFNTSEGTAFKQEPQTCSGFFNRQIHVIERFVLRFDKGFVADAQ